MMTNDTSLTLLSQLRASSNQAWNRFVDLYGPWIGGWLRRQGIPDDIVEDVLQESLLKVFSEIATFDHNGRKGAFRAWLRNVTHFRLRTVLRQKHRNDGVELAQCTRLADELADEDSGLTRLWNAEYDEYLVNRLLDMVATEFEPQSIVAFKKVVIECAPVKQVAAELNMSPNAVRIAQSRVLGALRRLGEGVLD